jgi:hypothetical protein
MKGEPLVSQTGRGIGDWIVRDRLAVGILEAAVLRLTDVLGAGIVAHAHAKGSPEITAVAHFPGVTAGGARLTCRGGAVHLRFRLRDR